MPEVLKYVQITQATVEAVRRLKTTIRTFKYDIIEQAVLDFERKQDQAKVKAARTRRENT